MDQLVGQENLDLQVLLDNLVKLVKQVSLVLEVKMARQEHREKGVQQAK